MYCPNCGDQISAYAEVCPKCGVRVKETSSSGEDKPNIAVNLISFCCIPILGIVMFFVWKDNKPRAAKSALIWALVSIVLWFILSFGFGLLGAVLETMNY
ncbi:zinc ribbon domain-containing protein [Lysinibacillus telephonicus]|uniref:Zinc ribbon domain-containing protein n=1 Tax=Lysinibacillus telephonicus TaxID=1714840 RepID=A0A431UQT8_9BACI|nr:zinc ribbon domain-containing protein [Lysinibacillus telephonicus]RTQ92454.1 zinc ribbon domain-containing protein [Lysinibacillus telephonicus]